MAPGPTWGPRESSWAQSSRRLMTLPVSPLVLTPLKCRWVWRRPIARKKTDHSNITLALDSFNRQNEGENWIEVFWPFFRWKQLSSLGKKVHFLSVFGMALLRVFVVAVILFLEHLLRLISGSYQFSMNSINFLTKFPSRFVTLSAKASQAWLHHHAMRFSLLLPIWCSLCDALSCCMHISILKARLLFK